MRFTLIPRRHEEWPGVRDDALLDENLEVPAEHPAGRIPTAELDDAAFAAAIAAGRRRG